MRGQRKDVLIDSLIEDLKLKKDTELVTQLALLNQRTLEKLSRAVQGTRIKKLNEY